ncbi:hypothetical protein LY76DRAFT_324161 [Colletotrichum caudatum]|nr:hypothetical protein LY76DRAFT_324161 [Colletotrichum caudatum]
MTELRRSEQTTRQTAHHRPSFHPLDCLVSPMSSCPRLRRWPLRTPMTYFATTLSGTRHTHTHIRAYYLVRPTHSTILPNTDANTPQEDRRPNLAGHCSGLLPLDIIQVVWRRQVTAKLSTISQSIDPCPRSPTPARHTTLHFVHYTTYRQPAVLYRVCSHQFPLFSTSTIRATHSAYAIH